MGISARSTPFVSPNSCRPDPEGSCDPRHFAGAGCIPALFRRFHALAGGADTLAQLERRPSEYEPGMTNALGLIAVVLVVAANAFFVAAEYALVTARRTRM